MVYAFGATLANAGIASLLPFMGLLIAMTGTLVSGTAFLLSVLYLSRDGEALAALPVTGRTVFAVKMSQVFLGEAAVSLPMAWPILIIFGMVSKMGVFYYAKAIVVWLCALSLPLVLSAMITLPLMRWSALWRRRDIVAVAGGIVIMGVFMIGQMYLTTRLPALLEGSVMINWLLGKADLFDRIAIAIPPLWLSLRALTITGADSLLYLFGLIALAAGLIVIALWLAGRLYQRGVSAQSEIHKDTRGANLSVNTEKTFRRRSPRTAVFLREMRTTLRTPVYAMNTVTLIVVFPLMMVAMAVAGSVIDDPELSFVMQLFRSYAANPFTVALMTAGLSMLMGSINAAASTPISREGRMFMWSRVCPVPYAIQAEGKLLFALSLGWAQALLMTVSFGWFSLRLPLPGLAMGLLLSIPALIPVTVLQLTVDLSRPKLRWVNPIEAIKQNANTMIGMAYGWLFTAAIGVPAGLLLIKAGVSASLMFAVILIITVILSYISLRLLRTMSDKAYTRVEI
jgi:ABC-2 type transport system permease protein